METYICQLLDDIRAAHRPEEPEPAAPAMPWESEEDRAVREIEEMFEEVERYVNEVPPHSLSYYCGLSEEQFPLEEVMSDEQVAGVVDAYVKMIRSWNIDTDIPGELPRRTAYPLLISLLGERFHIDKWGINTWSFCSCEPTTCPYAAHCICKEFEWVKELPGGDESDAELRERDRLRRRRDDDLGPLAGSLDFPV